MRSRANHDNALLRKLRRIIAKSWILSSVYYPLRGARLLGRPNDEIWYFAYSAAATLVLLLANFPSRLRSDATGR
jgi:hypothetical protein